MTTEHKPQIVPLKMCHCGRDKARIEIEGRVLVCDECAKDDDFREWARKDWR